MNKKVILIIGAAVALVAVCICLFVAILGGGIFAGLGMTQPVADVGEKFMEALKSGDYDAAYAFCHPNLQRELGSAQGLKRIVESGKARPTTWNFSSRNIDNDRGHIAGTVTMQGGAGDLTLDLIKVGDAWKVIAFDMKAK